MMACPLTHERPSVITDTMLATVVCIDGFDPADASAGAVVARFGGRIWPMNAKHTVATFDAPSRAIRCVQCLRASDGTIRAGMHAGQIDVRDEEIAGLAVQIAGDVIDAAGDGAVLVSRTVAELLAGSGLDLVALGRCGELDLFAVG